MGFQSIWVSIDLGIFSFVVRVSKRFWFQSIWGSFRLFLRFQNDVELMCSDSVILFEQMLSLCALTLLSLEFPILFNVVIMCSDSVIIVV